MPIIDHNQAPEVPWRPGYRKWDITTHEHGVSTSLSLNTAEPGTGAPLHTHAIDELIVILSGALEVRINGETHRVEKDHTLVIPPGRSTPSGLWARKTPSCWWCSRTWTLTPTITPPTWKAAVRWLMTKANSPPRPATR